MKSVAPHALLVQRVGDGEAVRHRRMAAMECGIEAGDLRHSGKPLPQTLQHIQRGRIVQRRQRRDRLDPIERGVIGQHRAIEVGAAVHDAVPERSDLSGQRTFRQFRQRLHRFMRIGGRHRSGRLPAR